MKALARSLVPGLYRLLQAVYDRAVVRRRRIWTDRYTRRPGNLTVASGPFAGMRYLRNASQGAIIPRLLGCYELELHSLIEEVVAREYSTIVDVGCAEGYYAVGLARRMPAAIVHAFDIDPKARESCRKLAELNETSDRVRVSAECAPESLRELAGPRTLMIFDCEGAEVDLLPPESVQFLAETDLIVELHDHIVPEATELLLERFSGTHHITLIEAMRRNPGDFPQLAGLTPADQAFLVSDQRPDGMRWAWLENRTAGRDELNEPGIVSEPSRRPGGPALADGPRPR